MLFSSLISVLRAPLPIKSIIVHTVMLFAAFFLIALCVYFLCFAHALTMAGNFLTAAIMMFIFCSVIAGVIVYVFIDFTFNAQEWQQ